MFAIFKYCLKPTGNSLNPWKSDICEWLRNPENFKNVLENHKICSTRYWEPLEKYQVLLWKHLKVPWKHLETHQYLLGLYWKFIFENQTKFFWDYFGIPLNTIYIIRSFGNLNSIRMESWTRFAWNPEQDSLGSLNRIRIESWIELSWNFEHDSPGILNRIRLESWKGYRMLNRILLESWTRFA